jgi:hypothetical protein
MYYPLSQITPNLYTNGDELVIASTLTEYIGYYYETSTGEKYVGKTPQGNSQILLIPLPGPANEEETYSNQYIREISFFEDADPQIDADRSLLNQLTVTKYSYVSSIETPKVRKIPSPIKSYYTQEEFELGEYKRYFSKKTNQYTYMEISSDEYKKLKSKDPTIAFDLYECVELWWTINKPNTNSPTVNGFPVIIEQDKRWFGFAEYVSQLSLPSLIPSSLNGPSSLGNSSFSGGTSGGGGGY